MRRNSACADVEEVKFRLRSEFQNIRSQFSVCGIISKAGVIYPLGHDTKVLSTAFELVIKQTVYRVASEFNLIVSEPESQNCYPDFTLHPHEASPGKIALDVKTTYRSSPEEKVGFTLGSYTSFIRPGKESKNIAYPFPLYARHIIAGFIYEREGLCPSKGKFEYSLEDLNDMRSPVRDIECFVREKWEIASDTPGSGNTANIGSMKGPSRFFTTCDPLFNSEAEFLSYWKNYIKDRKSPSFYASLNEYRGRANY